MLCENDGEFGRGGTRGARLEEEWLGGRLDVGEVA
jgi:hypothetical protein